MHPSALRLGYGRLLVTLSFFTTSTFPSSVRHLGRHVYPDNDDYSRRQKNLRIKRHKRGQITHPRGISSVHATGRYLVVSLFRRWNLTGNACRPPQIDVVFPTCPGLEESLAGLDFTYQTCESTLREFLEFAGLYARQR